MPGLRSAARSHDLLEIGILPSLSRDLCNPKMPQSDQPGGAGVGWLTDKFSINWTVSIDKA